MGTITATANGITSTITVNRPKFSELWKAYPVGVSADKAYEMVGGNVYQHYLEDPNGYANACALRLSRAFNYGGLVIQKGPGAYKLRGGDGKAYIMRVQDMIKFVRLQFGKPDIAIAPANQSSQSQFMGKKGIIIFSVNGWQDASGHVTLWNGQDCGDHCYFIHNQPNVTTTQIQFWELK